MGIETIRIIFNKQWPSNDNVIHMKKSFLKCKIFFWIWDFTTNQGIDVHNINAYTDPNKENLQVTHKMPTGNKNLAV